MAVCSGCRSPTSSSQRGRGRHPHRGCSRARAAWPRRGRSATSSLGSALPRHPALGPADASAAGRRRPRRRAAVGRDQDRLLRHRQRAALGVRHRRVPEAAGPQPARQAPPRRHHLLRVQDPQGHADGDAARRRSGCGGGRASAPTSASGCRCCGPSWATPTSRRRRRSSGRRSSGSTRRGAPASRRRCSATCPAATPARVARFGEVLAAEGVKVETSRPVRAVRRAANGLDVHGVDGAVDRVRPCRRHGRRPPGRRPLPGPHPGRAGQAPGGPLHGRRVRVARSSSDRWRPTTSPTSPTPTRRSRPSSR